ADLAGDLIVLAAGDREHPQVAVDEAAGLLQQGFIVAIKGLGGFHLACDATDEQAVRELKRRKGRPHKPLAVMFADLDQMRVHCRVSAAEAELLQSPEHPIVLLEWRELGPSGEPLAELGGVGGGPEISPEVAVRQRYLGCMLPYTPLHLLLLRAAGRPLVMTSGNLAEEPIVTSWGESGRLGSIPDAYLLHDRGIRARYDDSVALVRSGTPRLVRRSRGYAPFPLPLPDDLPPILACGAELKSTFCLTRDRHAFISQHIGDLENLETLESFHDGIDLYQDLFGVAPEVVAFDLHPEYLATKYAVERLSAADSRGERAPRGVGVQHHHAHIVSCMTENGVVEPVIGVSLDGLGYGADGHLWGGELLVCDALGFRRVAHLEYLPLPGGSLAIRTPARTAAGWLAAALGPGAVGRALAAGLELGEQEADVVLRQVETGLNAPLTSSCGRLFDCVAALAGLRGSITYEGQAAVELEMVSRPGADLYPYALDGDLDAALVGGLIGVIDRPGTVVSRADGPGGELEGGATAHEPLRVRLAPLLEAVLADAEAGRSPALIGSRLHATVAGLLLDLARRVRRASGIGVVALSGGVFQNRLLTDLSQDALEADGFRVLTHALVPANDGGLSLGQAVIAGYNQRRRRDDPCA
ncbi:MAG: carbamoyltransferase HypF, partial [Actinobacteria bacterium]|nr:carbamoyltransferase HypF [Actinomycetota bacterium]